MELEVLGANVQKFRNMKRMPQKALAEEIGIAVQSLSRIERGLTFPSFENLVKIMEILEVTPNQLFLSESISKELNDDLYESFEKHADLISWSDSADFNNIKGDFQQVEFKSDMHDGEEFYKEIISKLEEVYEDFCNRDEQLFSRGDIHYPEYRRFLDRLFVHVLGEEAHCNAIRMQDEKRRNTFVSKRVVLPTGEDL